MNWVRANPRSALLCGISLALPVLVWGYVALALMELRASAVKEIDYLAPRIARLQGLIAYEQGLSATTVEARERLALLAYPASVDIKELSASMQSDIRQLFADAGMAVSNSQVSAPVDEDLLERISVRLAVSGELGALQGALHALAAHEPVLVVESLEVRPENKRRDDKSSRLVSANIKIQALRVKG
ncbi:MAG: hypothetical protein Hals2KO_30370 [Halioglobus sp.]